MSKFMDLSKREIERIWNDGQVVYERENRLLKEARDDALKHVEVLESTRIVSAQTADVASARTELKMRRFEISQLKLTLEEKATSARSTERALLMAKPHHYIT
eukprot:jgi/Phyca11/14192/fgenesh1_pg.PHYCAscaffold_6_\